MNRCPQNRSVQDEYLERLLPENVQEPPKRDPPLKPAEYQGNGSDHPKDGTSLPFDPRLRGRPVFVERERYPDHGTSFNERYA
jgi:hypothetical protein